MKKLLIVFIGIFSGIALGLGAFGISRLLADKPEPPPEESMQVQEIAPPPTLAPTLPPMTEAPTQPEPETEPTQAPTVQPITEPQKTEPPETQPPARPQETGISFREADATVYATASCNVRSGPSVKEDSLGKLQKGSSVKRLAIGENGWIRISYEDREAYVYGEYLTEKAPAREPSHESVDFDTVSETVYSTASVNVRSGPGKGYKAIGYLKRDYSAKRIGIGSNGWSKILYEGKEAYVYSDYLTTDKPEAPAEPQKPAEPAETTPKPAETRPPKDTEPAPTETVPAETSKPAEPYETVNETVVATDSINIRSGPGKNHKAIGYLKPGSSIKRIAIGRNGWSKVIYEDQIAYASSQYLKAEKPSQEPGKPPAPSKPQEPENNEEITYEKVAQMVYAIELVNVREKATTDSKSLGKLEFGESVQRVGIGSNGWSKVVYQETVAYVRSEFLSTQEPEVPDFGDTSIPGFATPNAPFIYQYWEEEGLIPHAMFEPVAAEEGPLPLIISLHGASEVGKNREFLESRFLVKEFREWEYTGLKDINAYVVCPHLTGAGHPDSWATPKGADLIFDLIDELKEIYEIDSSRIILEGHSMGAQGALYIAADERADFSAVVVLDAYEPGVDIKNIDASVRGYTSDYEKHPGSRRYYDYMSRVFGDVFPRENWFILKGSSHDSLPKAVFTMDKDKDKQSDMITWLLAQ